MVDSFEKKLENIENLVSTNQTKSVNIQLPTDNLEWISKARPFVGKVVRNFAWEPFWIEPYRDKSPNIVIVNGRQCIEENEYVYTKNGVKKASDLVEGDESIAGKISQIHSFEDDLYEIVFFNGVKIKVNGQHPFYTKKGWKKAQNLTNSDEVEFQEANNFEFEQKSIGKIFAKLLGYLYSDGYYGKGQSVMFANANKKFTQEVVTLTNICWPMLNPVIKEIQTKWSPSYQTWLITKHGSNKNPLIDFINNNHLMGDTHGLIQCLVKDELVEFVRAFFNGDGYLWTNQRPDRETHRAEIGFAIGIHKRRAVEFQYILWRLGINSIVKEEWMKKSTRPFYRVICSRFDEIQKLIKILDTQKYPDKFLAVEHLTKSQKTGGITKNESSEFVKIRKINKIEKGKVVGFAVTPTHEIISYCGMRTHNTFKSTFGTDIVGCYITSHDNCEVTYIVDREDRVSAWSKQRFRKDTMQRNELLRGFLPHGRANVSEINLTNDSVLYIRTDENEYNNVQGMTNSLMIFDECQYQELQFRAAALYSMTMTKGQCYYLGIGGEAGSEWYKLWKKSDQMEWVFKDKYWREKLKFDSDGYLCNEHPENIVAGNWVPTYPQNKEYRGYHMPQTIFARIPLTIDDAVNLYKTRPENSIEFQKKYNPTSIVQAHVYGNFYKAMRRPITPEMVEACYDYTISLLSAKQVRELKQEYQNEILIFLGIDWGSGPSASKTVGTILIYWKKTNRFQIAWIDVRPMEHEYDQAAYFVKLFSEYCCDFCVADLGYGKDKVTLMQQGGYTSFGEKINGLGRGKVKGCWSSGTITEETMRHKNQDVIDAPTVGEKKEYYSVDKTQVIQNFVDFVGSTVPDENGKPVSQLMIPMKKDWECEFLLDDFCDITRKDLDKQNEEVVKEDPRQKAKKEYNHARDSVMSIIYCMVGKSKFDPQGFQISKIRMNRRFRYKTY